MTEASTSCPKCGAAIPPEAPQGLCPKCLLHQASFPTETGAPTRHTRPAPPDRDELARAFPHLQILELIGQGGMGFVYKARQPKLDRLVALKILAQPLAEQTAFAERFTREGRTLAKLNHPNIVTIHDFGQAGPFFYLLMEYVDGVNLRQAMRAGAINSTQALAIVPRICEALQYAHNEGILHRDIKPDNILLDNRGRVKIADFGIAKLVAETIAENPLTGAGATLGTPHYMAPEQIEKPNAVDHRADIYSLGVVFYEMLTGELPLGRFAAPSATSGNDPRLDEIVFQTLEKQPDRRPQSASEVGSRVETISTTVAPPKRLQQAPTAKQFSFAFIAAMAFLFGGMFLIQYLNRPAAPAGPPEKSATPSPISAPHSNPIPDPSPADKFLVTENAYFSEDTFGLRSETEFFAGETIAPVIRFMSGPWETTDASATEHTTRTPHGIHRRRDFSWRIPKSFTLEFERRPALRQFNAAWLNKPISLPNGQVTPLITMTNSQGQIIACGFRFTKTDPTIPQGARAILRDYALELGGSRATARFADALPAAYRAEGSAHINGAPQVASTTRNSDGITQIQWNLPPGFNVGPPRRESGSSVEFNLGQSAYAFSATNSAGEIYKAHIDTIFTTPKTFIFDSINTASNYIVLRSENAFLPGESLRAIITDSHGNQTRAISGMNTRNSFKESKTTASVMWNMPENAPTNWVELTTQKIGETILHKPIRLIEGGSQRLFHFHTYSGGLQKFASVVYESVRPSPTRTSAVVQVRSSFALESGAILHFNADVPPGYRLEADCEPAANGWTSRLNASEISDQEHFSAHWDFGLGQKLQFTEPLSTTISNTTAALIAAPITITTTQPATIFTIKTPARDYRATLKLTTRNDQ